MKKDSLLDAFNKQAHEVDLSKIYGGLVQESIGHYSTKTELADGHVINDTMYRPD